MTSYSSEDLILAGTLLVMAGEVYLVIKDKPVGESYVCLLSGVGDEKYPVEWCWTLTENTILQRRQDV